MRRDPALVAGLVVAQRLPWLVFTLFSGARVDRLDRRRVMVGANVLRAVALAALGFGLIAGRESLAALYAAFFALGVAETFVANASLAILPAIVSKEELERASGRIFATASATNELVGPPIGGALFAGTPVAPFLTGAAAFGVAAVAAGSIIGEFGPPERKPLRVSALGSEIGEGLRWFWREPVVRAASLWAAAANLSGAATGGVLVLLAQEQLGLDGAGFGLLLAAGAVGGIGGGLLAERVIELVGRGGAVFVSNLLAAAPFVASAAFMVVVAFALMSVLSNRRIEEVRAP